MSTMNGRRVTIFTGRNFLRTTASVSGLVDGGVVDADLKYKGGIGGV